MNTIPRRRQKLISIVIPVYNEEQNLPALYNAIKKHIGELSYRFELIFVDDGSSDNSVQVIKGFLTNDTSVRLVELARNFGKEAATSAGLHRVNGDAALMIDADMQMPPSLIGEFIERWEEGYEVVVGVFAKRSMSFLRKTGAKYFYRIMNKVSQTNIKPNATDYRLLDRKVVKQFCKMPEHNRMTRGLIDWLGFKRSYIYFKQRPRQHGDPTYSFAKLINLALNSFIAHSLFPLKFAGALGVVILSLSIPGSIFLFIERWVLNDPLKWGINGTTMLAMMTLFLIGVVLICLGSVSLYIGHIHSEAQRRPLYVVRNDLFGEEVMEREPLVPDSLTAGLAEGPAERYAERKEKVRWFEAEPV